MVQLGGIGQYGLMRLILLGGHDQCVCALGEVLFWRNILTLPMREHRQTYSTKKCYEPKCVAFLLQLVL